jgi:hypothetical protein
MSTRSKLLLGGLAAALVMAAFVGSASARRIEISEPRFRAVFAPLTFGAEGQTPVVCRVTLEGSFHSRTLSKVVGALLGYVTAAETANCTSETARALRETLPWHILYVSFTGTLPNISSIRIDLRNAAFLVRAFGFVSCLYRTEEGHPAMGEVLVSAGVARELRADENVKIPGPGLCPEGFFQGRAEVFVLGSTTTRITVRLVQ